MTDRSLVQRNPTECDVPECDHGTSTMRRPWPVRSCQVTRKRSVVHQIYEGWNFDFGNTPLDWIQELLESRANAAGRMGPFPTYIHNGSGTSRNGHTQ